MEVDIDINSTVLNRAGLGVYNNVIKNMSMTYLEVSEFELKPHWEGN
jgi:hypothetical protein